MNSLTSKNTIPDQFWERKEGMTGMFLLAFAIFGGAWAAYTFLPILAKVLFVVMKSVWLSAFSIAGIGIFAMIVTSPRTWKLASYAFRSISRMITGWFVAIDPIGIMKSYAEDLGENLVKMTKHLDSLRGQMTGLKKVIDENAEDKQKALGVARQAHEKGKATTFALQARKAGRLAKSNKRLEDVYRVMEVLYKALFKYREVCGALVEDLGSEIDIQEREQKAMRAAWGVIRSAKAIMYGQATGRELFDQATECLAQDYAGKKGEIDQFLDMSKGFIEGFDLQSGMYEADALAAIEEWSKKGDSLLLGDQSQWLLEDLPDEILPSSVHETSDYVRVLSATKTN